MAINYAEYFRRVNKKIKKVVSKIIEPEAYDFNKSNPLGDNGERVDIQLNEKLDFDQLDIYQKSHWKRYEFSKELISANELCGDFACGTGYGAVLLAGKAKSVIGADLNAKVINAITKRYENYKNVFFINKDLLQLDFNDEFDSIISFETLEHFSEPDIQIVLGLFNTALKDNGKLIFSTPYMQLQSEEAIKMGHHLTFNIDEIKINRWLNDNGFQIEMIKYQNYNNHNIEDTLTNKEFIICVARKKHRL